MGLGDWGALLASQAGLLTFDVQYPPGNSIVRVSHAPDDGLAAGFQPLGYAFINLAAVFDNLGDNVGVATRIVDEPNFLVSGFWPGWQESGAAGLPVAIHNVGSAQDVTLIGFDITFRAHPEDTFRMLANAIYGGLE